MAAEILIRAVSFLSTPIFSRVLPVDVYGNVKTFESWLSVLAPILSLGLFTNIEVARHRYKERFQQYVSSVMFLIVAVHGAVLCLVMLLRGPLGRLLDFSPSMLLVAVLYCCFYSCILCVMRQQRILLRYKASAALSMLAAVPALLISIVCCTAAGDVSAAELLDIRIVSFYTPIILLGIAAALYTFIREKTLVRPDYWRYALKISLPLIMYQISLQVLTQSDRIMIKHMVGAEAAAIFSMGTTVIYIIEIVHKGFESAWIPWLYKKLSEKEYTLINQAVQFVQLGFGLMFLYVLLLGNEVVLILGGRRYLDAVWLLGPMLGGVIFQFLMLSLADIEKFYQKENYVGIISIAIAGLNLLLNYLGIRFFGYRAAAYTTMLSYITAVVTHLVLIRVNIPMFRMSSVKIFLLCGGIGAISLVGMVSYRLSIISRYTIIAGLTILLGIAGIITWKNIKKGKTDHAK